MKRMALWCIRFYQRRISPLKRYSTCRFVPTCSEYAYQAIDKYGCFKGGRMAILRLLRCHPFHPGGFDPVK
jgi:putative membrane protein insertion efficiency factor